MSCISTFSVAILINGTTIDFFSSTKGIKQDDMLFSYIFIFCIRCFETLIKITNRDSYFSHLFYVNDLIMMAKANISSINTINQSIDLFRQLSTQCIKKKTFKIISSANCNVTTTFGTTHTNNFEKYFGFLSSINLLNLEIFIIS